MDLTKYNFFYLGTFIKRQNMIRWYLCKNVLLLSAAKEVLK